MIQEKDQELETSKAIEERTLNDIKSMHMKEKLDLEDSLKALVSKHK